MNGTTDTASLPAEADQEVGRSPGLAESAARQNHPGPVDRTADLTADLARQLAADLGGAQPEARAHAIAAAAWRYQLNRHALAALVDQLAVPTTPNPNTPHGAIHQ